MGCDLCLMEPLLVGCLYIYGSSMIGVKMALSVTPCDKHGSLAKSTSRWQFLPLSFIKLKLTPAFWPCQEESDAETFCWFTGKQIGADVSAVKMSPLEVLNHLAEMGEDCCPIAFFDRYSLNVSAIRCPRPQDVVFMLRGFGHQSSSHVTFIFLASLCKERRQFG